MPGMRPESPEDRRPGIEHWWSDQEPGGIDLPIKQQKRLRAVFATVLSRLTMEQFFTFEPTQIICIGHEVHGKVWTYEMRVTVLYLSSTILERRKDRLTLEDRVAHEVAHVVLGHTDRLLHETSQETGQRKPSPW